MAELHRLCMGCMRDFDANLRVCPFCGDDAAAPQHAPYLPKKTVLLGRYLVGKLIRLEADSAIYIGQDLQSGETVDLREFLPVQLVQRAEGETQLQIRVDSEALFRQAMGSFESLWRAIMGLKDCSALPQVRDILFCNETVYAVTKHLDAITLSAYIEPGKRLNFPSANKSFRGVILALEQLHGISVIHGSIAPSNLFVGADGKLHLDGFTIPQTKTSKTLLSSEPAGGFAPLERYDDRIRIGAFTDVYSVAACMLFSMTGEAPPNASERVMQDQLQIPLRVAETLPGYAADALTAALQVYPQRRIRTMEQFLDALTPVKPSGVPSAAARPQHVVVPAPPKPIPVTNVPDAAPKNEASNESESDKKPKKETSMFALACKVFFSVLLVGCLLFSVLYATVFYSHFRIPFLDSAFSILTFLPLNEGQQQEDTTTAPIETAKQPDRTFEVPDFTSLRYRDIMNNRTFNENFTLHFTFEESKDVKQDSIIRQSIEAGKRVEKGTEITVFVSSGIPQVVLKDVIDMPYADAFDILTEDGFIVKEKTQKNDGAHTPGTVCNMSRVAGIQLQKGSEITLYVWDNSGITQPTVPPSSEALVDGIDLLDFALNLLP